MPDTWKAETEKKYKLSGGRSGKILANQAKHSGLHLRSWMLQKDLILDFAGYKMREQGILMRIRNNSYTEGSGPEWVLTLKERSVQEGIHSNRELEAGSDNSASVPQIAAFINKRFGADIDVLRLARLDMDYIRTAGLTECRMYIEKHRQEYSDDAGQIILAIDELPAPAGWYAEIELQNATDFLDWETKLGLADVPVETRDYGELVKELTKDLPYDQQRRLVFAQ